MSNCNKLTGEYLETIKEKYLSVRRLLAKSDPETEPYKSSYEARDILCELEKLLADKADDSDGPTREKSMLAVVHAMIGEISLHTQETDLARQHLKKAKKYLKGDRAHRDNVLCSVYTLNQLGLLFSSVDRIEKTLKYLSESERLYRDFVSSTDGSYLTFSEMFTGEAGENAAEESLEKAHTLTLYYMAQAYRIDNRLVQAAQYCHNTLRRQLSDLTTEKRIEWALNAAALSQVFLEHYMFLEAHHHLCAAGYILDLRKADLDAVVSDEERQKADLEEFKHRSSDVALCWVKYDIMLLNISKERLVKEGDEAQKFCQYPDEMVGLVFPNLELGDYEKVVTKDFLLTYDDARLVFLHGQDCINKGKEYYTLEEHASDYIKIQQDLSQLYHGLQFFEDDEARTCKMWKRRADILSEVVHEVSPVHYLLQCREIYFELGEIYSSMFDSKSNCLPEERDGHQITKCIKLLQQAISSYQSFIDSFKDRRTGSLPEFVDEGNERSFLLAHIYVARLRTKLLNRSNDIAHVNNQVNSLANYKYVLDYCNKKKEKFGNDAPKILLDSELSVCEEMVQILPLAIQKLGVRQ